MTLNTAAPAAYARDGQACSEQAFYALACDPQQHVVVQACAGAGKTWMLVSRIVRALLAGAQPHEILAITFTKKAAGEMRARLQEWLLAFSKASPEELAQELQLRGISKEIALSPSPDLRSLLSKLYQLSLLHTRPVQIRTFHSWFASLLRSAPLAVLEALQLPSPYELLEDDEQAIDLVWPRFYALLQREPGLHAVYRAAVAQVGRSSMETALSLGLKKRVEFALADAAGVVDLSVPTLTQALPAFAGCDDPLQRLAQARTVLLDAAKSLAQTHQPSFRARGPELEQAVSAQNWAEVIQVLLTQKGEPRKFSDSMQGIEQVRQAQQLCLDVQAALEHQAAWQHHRNMAQLMRALSVCFAELKRARGWVDMGDLEQAALRLLKDEQIAGWVQQRLDAQVTHLLIDEFQDTNPLQWQALQSWLSGYAGAGGGAGMPSVFIVGDAKQSIYRFRRAEPQVFEAATDFVCRGLGGHLLSCDHTRRNAPQVMAAVNAVMGQAASESGYPFRAHTTASQAQGQVLRLPLAPRPPKPEGSEGLQWRDSLTEPRDLPQDKAVDAECALAARWVAAQLAQGLPPQHVMVLARKRDRLSRMRDALRQWGIASQISEKTALIELPEVRDVVALLDALVSPGDDLALAQALKSPLWGWSDAHLAHLAAQQRANSAAHWLDLLLNQEQGGEYWRGLDAGLVKRTGDDLRQCQAWLSTLPPHDALSAIYERLDVMARFASAAPAPLRPRVQASLQALLFAALEAKGGRFLTPHAWIRELKNPHLKAPQSIPTQAVQLMTVHGAKGLEAPTVILLDTHANEPPANRLDVLVDWPGQASAPTVFAFLRSEKRLPLGLQEALAHEQAQRAREDLNALYVAMTRARERLVISGHEAARTSEQSPWRRFEALGDLVEDAWQADLMAPQGALGQLDSDAPFSMPFLPPALAESGFSATRNEVTPEPELAARIGSCMHRLLELYRPGQDGAALASRIAQEFGLDTVQARQAWQAAQSILSGPAAWAWDERVVDWQGDEVELIHQGQWLRIDRLVRQRESQTWWVLDYKSHPKPQQDPELLAQLRRYREAVMQAYPGQSVRAAFVTAQGECVEIEGPA